MTDQMTDTSKSPDLTDGEADDAAESTTTTSADPPDDDTADPPDDDTADPPDDDTADPPDDDTAEPADAKVKAQRRRLSISLSVRSLLVGFVIMALVGAIAVLGWLYVGAERKLDAQAVESANDARAEKIALDYAVNAATMDFKDLQAWKVKLVAGTSQELNDKLSQAASSMEQILVPLEWTSTAEPLVAKVRSRTGGITVVDCFVSVQTKTVQAPDPLQSTATYGVTIDSNWVITDVGGIGSVVGPR